MSDEEAQEVVRLLSPTIESEGEWQDNSKWPANNSTDQETPIEEHAKTVGSMDDSFVYSRRGSHSESESGNFGSISSLGEQVC